MPADGIFKDSTLINADFNADFRCEKWKQVCDDHARQLTSAEASIELSEDFNF
jgi:hypothetical protein